MSGVNDALAVMGFDRHMARSHEDYTADDYARSVAFSVAVSELLSAASAYVNGYCLDEASEDGPEFTGCTKEQHEAAMRLAIAIARVQP